MGSPDINLVNAGFEALPENIRRDYTLRKEILWESCSATKAELSAKEVEMIRLHRSNDPAVGYNRWPKHSLDNDLSGGTPNAVSKPLALRPRSEAVRGYLRGDQIYAPVF